MHKEERGKNYVLGGRKKEVLFVRIVLKRLLVVLLSVLKVLVQQIDVSTVGPLCDRPVVSRTIWCNV